jgi:hypothetical protein
MKTGTKWIFVCVLLLSMLVSGCAPRQTLEPTTTSIPPTSTNTPIPTPTYTSTPEPTATLEPSPTPVPLGGGGKLIMREGQELWLSASSDGSNLKLIDWPIWSLSPDGKRALTYTSDSWVALTNLDGTGTIPLDDTLRYYINNNTQTALWLPNGNVVLLAYEQKKSNKISAYMLSPDGKLKKWEKPSQIMKQYAELLFISPDGQNLYWENDISCGNRQCKTQYYVTKLDDSDQMQILKNVNSAQNIYISPSGQYITYLDNSFQVLRGCFVYKVADDTVTKILPDGGLDYCFGGNHWSPIEDKLFGQTSTGYSMLNVLDGKITTFSGVNAGSCYLASWTPDGKHLFLSVCTKEDSYKQNGLNGGGTLDYMDFIQSLVARLIDISDGKVTEYPDAGFCNAVISPDSKWVLFYHCKNENLVVNPSQLLNLDTKQIVPLFNGDKLEGSDEYRDRSVFWIP